MNQMSKEIPEDVYNSIETLAKYCKSHSICKHCPFAYKVSGNASVFSCKLYSKFRASEWMYHIMKTEKTETINETIYEVI